MSSQLETDSNFREWRRTIKRDAASKDQFFSVEVEAENIQYSSFLSNIQLHPPVEKENE